MATTNDPERIARGGKAVYGARLGILMLEARFPRIAGDMGNATTWPFPVLYKVVKGASPQRVVRERAAGLLDTFLEAAKELADLGADGITTNCGFLSLFQDDIARHVGVPVATSSLMQAPFIERVLPPGQRVGILTISAATLTPEHLSAAGVADGTPIVGTDGGRESAAPFSAMSSNSTSPPPSAIFWTREKPWCGNTRMLARSCSNAPTCRPTRARSGRPVQRIPT
jgi:hypothetical protein